MVSFFYVAAISALSVLQSVAHGAQVGEYFRPNAADTSGFPGTTATYRRSPCPAINSLANHGYIPRDGQNVTREMLRDSIVEVFNIDIAVAQGLANFLPAELSLDFLSTHSFIEHDASLVHADVATGTDPSLVDPDMAADLLGRATDDGKLGIAELGQVRRKREEDSKAMNPTYAFGQKEQFLAYGEAAFMLLGFGGKQADSTISVEHARSFMVDERIPADFVKASTPVTDADMKATKALLVAAAQSK